MTSNQKKYLLIVLLLILLLLGLLVGYWILTKFNPFTWISKHLNSFLVTAVLIIAGGLCVLGFYLQNKKRL